MASVEFVQKRLDGKKKELEKLEKKLSRILKAEESNYEENNPYYYSDYDKKHTVKDIEQCKNEIAKYEEQLVSEIEKSNSRNIPAIVEFLAQWKQRVYSFYEEDLIKYFDEKSALKTLYDEYAGMSYAQRYELGEDTEYHRARKSLYCKLNGYKERRTFINHWGKEDYRDIKVRDGEWEHLKHYVDRCNTLNECLALLDKELEQEKNRKYDFIIERTNKIVGQITDAAGLRVGAKGDLSGYIFGTKGKAHVETIGAGGYNIQVYHFRTLIKEVK
jgi:hypothetical protein